MEQSDGAAPRTSRFDRTREWGDRTHRRFWWHQHAGRALTPPVYSWLDDDEWAVLSDWFADTERRNLIGEMTVPMISVLQGFVMGSGIRSIVQLGHFAGYSTLLIGFMLRRMGGERGLASIDINPGITDYTRSWVDRAGLSAYVSLVVGDSASPASRDAALASRGRAPRLVVIDSSHQYAHTLRELDLWWESLAPGGLLFLHDTSDDARSFDKTGQGGVRCALDQWLAARPAIPGVILDGSPQADRRAAYADGCGLAILQKPIAVKP